MNALKWDKEFALNQAADDAELLQELLEIFKKSYASDLELIKEGIRKGDSNQVYSAAHSIKGASASLGIDGIKDIVISVESDSKKGSLEMAQKKIDELEELYLELKGL